MFACLRGARSPTQSAIQSTRFPWPVGKPTTAPSQSILISLPCPPTISHFAPASLALTPAADPNQLSIPIPPPAILPHPLSQAPAASPWALIGETIGFI